MEQLEEALVEGFQFKFSRSPNKGLGMSSSIPTSMDRRGASAAAAQSNYNSSQGGQLSADRLPLKLFSHKQKSANPSSELEVPTLSSANRTSTGATYYRGYSSEVGKILVKYDAEDYFQFISEIIGDLNLKRNIIDFSVLEVCDWISTLSFILKDETTKICEVFKNQWIDGEAFLNLEKSFWETFQFSRRSFALLSVIKDGWRGSFVNDLTSCDRDEIPCVVAGLKTDLSKCSPEKTEAIIEADEAAMSTGLGLVYGQLLCLGYKKFLWEEGSWASLGENNCKFMLKRKRVANGKIVSCSKLNASAYGNKFSFNYEPSVDMYQIGRMEFTQANDFVVSGPVHTNKSRKLTSPVSRFACRILCSRIFPFKCYIYSGGFDDENKLFLGDAALIVFNNKTKVFDALTTFGIHLWCTRARKWYEVSVRGELFASRSEFLQGISAGNLSSNELLSGSIIDICGVRLLFSNYDDLRSQVIYSPQSYMERLNALKPQCPVLLHSIQFAYKDQRERAKRYFKRLINSVGTGYMSSNDIRVPTFDNFDILENHRSYVYPACGHTYSYHKSLEGKLCPLCRCSGPYVPLCFEFEPSICAEKPTNVFNPCGHVASLEVCSYWSSIKMYTHENYDNRLHKMSCSHCPYCGSALSESKPYSRLILQTEFGTDKELDAFLTVGRDNLSELAGELYFWQIMYLGNSNFTKLSMVKSIKSSHSSLGALGDRSMDSTGTAGANAGIITSNAVIKFPKYIP